MEDDVSFSTISSSFSEVVELAGNFQRMHHAVRQRELALQKTRNVSADGRTAADMSFELDTDLRITFANRTAAQLIATRPQDFKPYEHRAAGQPWRSPELKSTFSELSEGNTPPLT